MGRRGKRRSSRGKSRGKRRVKHAKNGEEDRISELPDELINHILSHVDSKVATQTMVLSKRWVNLWANMSCLNFKPPKVGKYDNFVRNLLINRDQQYVLSKFTINFHHRRKEMINYMYFGTSKFVKEMLTICLDYALSHNVEHLSIRNGDLAYYNYLINFACIKTLRLICCENLNMMENNWTFPSLTTFYLKGYRIGKQISGFENLKELTLVLTVSIEEFEGSTITINCPKLERLTLSLNSQYTFIVATPILSYLNYRSGYVSVFSAADGFPCIKHVHIDIWKNMDRDFFDHPNGGMMKLGMQNFISLLNAVGETPFLELSSETIQGLRMIPNLSEYEPPSLGNLEFISLRGPGLYDLRLPGNTYHVLNYLLTNSRCAKIIRRFYK